jgi:hypothetical protein
VDMVFISAGSFFIFTGAYICRNPSRSNPASAGTIAARIEYVMVLL